MARYIDADKLIAHLRDELEACPNDENRYPISYGCRLGLQGAISFAETLSPTADVLPYLDDHHKQVACYTLGCKEGDKVKRMVAKEIFEEIEEIKKEYASGDIDGNELYVRLHLLEKKYTEEK